ncbi:hypothetical protein [Cytobacillus horneckiae]|uniref:hypothetical protein n=1 Tax=Cytobacillus horneckiae TaxID=549687 RepID=UPI003D1D293C
MESPRILFNNKKANKKNDSIITTNVRNTPQIPQPPRNQRRSRSDKKHDIKINLTLPQRQLLKRITKRMKDNEIKDQEAITSTYVCTQLLKKALLLEKGDFPKVQYPKSDSKKGRAKLEERYYNMLFEFTVKWDCSYAKAAHRIFVYALEVEGRELR